MIKSSIWWNCAKLVEKLLQKQQERLLNFNIFRHHMSSYCINPYMDAFYTSSAFQGYQEHQNWSLNKEVMQVPKLEENQQTVQHLQQERLLYFEIFRYHMSSYYINPIWMDSTLQDHSNGTKNTQIVVCMTKLWPYEVGAKTRGLQQTSRR